jgi:two-component system chemotaxis response regulator CheV
VAAHAEASNGRKVSDFVSLVLTDVEMPEMDGFMLTKPDQVGPSFCGHPGDHAFVACRGTRTSS